MATRITQKKLESETLVISSDMSDRLLPGETISTVESSIVVWSGTDPVPDAVLDGAPSHANNVISQGVAAGEPGVIYKVSLVANTSLNNILVNELKLAVIDENTGAL